MLPRIVFTCVVAVVGVTSIAAQTSGPVNVSSTVDVKEQSQTLVTMVRGLVTGAKEGTPLARLRQNVLDLQNYTSGLLVQLPGKVSECHTQAIIKMAAAAIGSHEVLNAMLANEPLGILSARIDLCLAMMSQVAQQLEGELTLSSDVSAHLAAILFATNTTINVIETADKALMEIILPPHNDRLPAPRVRRQLPPLGGQGFSFGKLSLPPFYPSYPLKSNLPFTFNPLNFGKLPTNPPFKTSVNLGKGFSLGFPDGLSWKSPKGNTLINLKPTFDGLLPNGVELKLNLNL